MPVVFDNLEIPGNEYASLVRVVVYLVVSADTAAGGVVTASDVTVIDKATAYSNGAGYVSLDLRPNVLLSPANSFYMWDTHLSDGRYWRRYIRVPNDAGPHHVETLDIGSPSPPLLPGADIQAAMDFAASSGGGEVFLGGGLYGITESLIWDTGVWIRGAGYGAVTLQADAGLDAPLIVSRDFDTLVGTDSTDGIHSCGIHGVTLDGDRANQSAGNLISVYGFDFCLSSIRGHSAKESGIYSEWSSSAAAPLPNISMEANLHDVKIDDCGAHGIDWVGPHDSKWESVTTWENSQDASGFAGMLVQGNGGGLQATNCHSWGGNQWDAVQLAAAGCLFSNCIAEGAGHAQVFIAAHDCLWDGQVYAVPLTGYAFVLGDTGKPVAGSIIRGRAITATASSTAGRLVFFFNEDGGNLIDLLNYETAAGSPISGGTPHADDSILIRTAGGGGSLAQNLLGNAKPTITGSRGGNAALADLLTDLATAGIITNSTSA